MQFDSRKLNCDDFLFKTISSELYSRFNVNADALVSLFVLYQTK